jgi:O-methyltransferase
MNQNLICASSDPATLYLDLLKKCLTRQMFGDAYRLFGRGRRGVLGALFLPITELLSFFHLQLVRRVSSDACVEGRHWPLDAETMIGMKRLDNLQHCVVDVITKRIPGDLIETGVWRGGATIFMRAVLKAYGDTDRTVWVADSFQGLPKPDSKRYPADKGDRLWTFPELAVSVEEVKQNFVRYDLLDSQVRFLVGWFRDTLPDAPIDRLAILRLDSDMYESTTDVLRYLYPRVSVGGYVIVDDYALPRCRAAIEDFRTAHDVTEKVHRIDWTGVFWQKLR